MTDAADDGSENAEPNAERGRRRLPPWLLPLLIGIVTITAGLFTWRAGQLGSSAAFEDRQAVGQTITQQEIAVEARLGAVDDAAAYVRYVADYAEAAALDDLSVELTSQGIDAFASTFAEDADQLRQSASLRAQAAGVFGEESLLEQQVVSPDVPLEFEIDRQVAQLEAQLTSGVGSPGVLDPDRWADQADDTRSRVRGLRVATFLLLLSVVALTVAQLSVRRPTRLLGAATGTLVFVTTVVVTVGTVY